MPITGTVDVPVGSTPKNVVSEYTLDAGSYFLQNTGPVPIKLRAFDTPVSDVNALNLKRGHELAPGGDISMTSTGSDALYVYVKGLGNKTTSVLSMTKET